MKTKFKQTARLLLASFIVLFTVVFAQAQQQSNPAGGQQGPRPVPNEKQIEKMVSDLSMELSLDEAQKKEVSEMFAAHFNEVKEVQNKYKSSHEAERKEMDGLRTEFEKEVKTILTNEQQKQFDAFMKDKKAQRKGNGKRPPKGK
jgi:Spy/CpxP family protein refolding chaperone